jgi:lipopolysaccharide transport system ATP-binding protein
MADDVIISFENVGKKFCRSLKRALSYGMQDVAKDILGLTASFSDLRPDEFWALRNVSFKVMRGECLGLLGVNGAGKSTLLRLLNGVILPDNGTVRVNGRTGGLLELGAGFHPMLTGRENIHLSGAIFGLSKKEISEKFDSIVEFAGLQEFIDSPVKYYSSGMYVRLGFAVAISTNPDIVILDESMAVGDGAFRKRCLDRINALIRAKRTIIVVSHNLQELERVVHRMLLLDHGSIRADGDPAEVVNTFLKQRNTRLRRDHNYHGVHTRNERLLIEITTVDLYDRDGNATSLFRSHDELGIHIKFIAHKPVVNPVFRVQIYRDDGVFCYGTNTARHEIELGEVAGEAEIVLQVSDLGLLTGDYSIRVAVLSTQYEEMPMHEVVLSPGIHVESKIRDGGGIVAISAEWSRIKECQSVPFLCQNFPADF